MPITLERTPVQNQIYAKALLDMGMGIGRVAKKVGMGTDTVIAVRDRQELSPSMFERIKGRLTGKWARLADDTLDLVDRNDIKKASVNARVWIAGVATDKLQDLEGKNKPVFNIVTVVNECKKTRDKLEAQMEQIVKAEACITSTQMANTQRGDLI